ncbi:MAG: hypothetical protein IBX58_10515 [Roseovarius sp.]|nr:hypothetical protein [Roseovarius sp.]
MARYAIRASCRDRSGPAPDRCRLAAMVPGNPAMALFGPNIPAWANHYILWPCCPPTQIDVDSPNGQRKKLPIWQKKDLTGTAANPPFTRL